MKHPMLTIGTVFLLAGLGVSFVYKHTALIAVAIAAIAVAACLLLRGKRRAGILFATLTSLFAVVYVGLSLLNTVSFSQYGEILAEGIATSVYQTENGSEITLEGKITAGDISLHKSATLYCQNDIELEAGDRIIASGKPIDTLGYSAEKGSVCFSADNVQRVGSGFSVKAELFKLNRLLCSAADKYLKSPYSEMLKAILLGDKSGLSDEFKSNTVAAGNMHIFVVSGFHISIIEGIVYFVCLFAGIRRRRAIVVAVISAWVAVLISGGGTPAVRAGVMATALLFSALLKRQSDSKSMLMLAGMVIVLASPTALTSASFLLTFCATAGVLFLSQPIATGIKLFYKIKSYYAGKLIEGAAVSFAAAVGILPISAVMFGGVSIISPVMSLLLMPLVILILPLGIIMLAASPLPPLASLAAGALEPLLGAVKYFTELFGGIKQAYIGLSYSGVSVLAVLAAITVLLFVILKEKRRLTGLSAAVLACILLLFPTVDGVLNSGVKEYCLSDGKGTAYIIKSGFEADVIIYGESRTIGKKIRQELARRNIYTVNLLVLDSKIEQTYRDKLLLADCYKAKRIVTTYTKNLLYGYDARLAGLNTAARESGACEYKIYCFDEGLVIARYKQ